MAAGCHSRHAVFYTEAMREKISFGLQSSLYWTAEWSSVVFWDWLVTSSMKFSKLLSKKKSLQDIFSGEILCQH